jgi:hypothetical protein
MIGTEREEIKRDTKAYRKTHKEKRKGQCVIEGNQIVKYKG